MIIIGSYPVQDVLGRKSRDIDLLAPLTEFQRYIDRFDGKPTLVDKDHAYYRGLNYILDCELIWPDSLSQELAEMILSCDDTTYDEEMKAYMPHMDFIYMLKMTHRFKKNSPHFLKTLRDIQKLRAAGAVIRPEHEDFYKRRLKATLWYEHPNLNRTKEEFFNPEDDFYVYDHDSIHEAIALEDRPAYVKYAVDGQEVLSSKKKFFEEVSEETRLYGVYEEACVLALERHQIPNDFKPDPKVSFDIALMKVCTSITSGWFREYAWEHYDDVLDLFQKFPNFVEKFRENSAKLRPYEGKMA